MSTIDEQITKYTLDPSQYVSGMQKILGGTGSFVTSTAAAVASSKTFTGSLLSLGTEIAKVGVTATLAAATGLGVLTGASLEQASAMELLTARFGALNGSFDVARQKITGLQALGRSKSLFGLGELQEAGGILEEAGLNMSRVLPLVNTLGNALGGTSGKAIAAATALRSIAEGADPLRTLRKFGINANDFRSLGGMFKRNGKMVQDSQATFSEIEAIIKKKFGNVDAYIQDTFQRRIAGLRNSFDVAAAAFGTGFLPVIGKVADKIGLFMGYLSDSGIGANVGKGLADGLSSLLGGGDVFVKLMSYGVAIIERIPDILRTVWDTGRDFFSFIADMLTSTINGIGSALTVGMNHVSTTVVNVVNLLSSGFASVFNEARHLLGDMYDLYAHVLQSPLLDDEEGAARARATAGHYQNRHNDMQALNLQPTLIPDTALSLNSLGKKFSDYMQKDFQSGLFGDIADRAGAIQKGFGSTSGAKPNNRLLSYEGEMTPEIRASLNPSTGTGGFFTSLYSPLTEIAENTKLTATNTNPNLKSFALGGGPIGQLGVTPVEFSAFRNRTRGANGININVHGARDAAQFLEDFARRIASETVAQNQRFQNGR